MNQTMNYQVICHQLCLRMNLDALVNRVSKSITNLLESNKDNNLYNLEDNNSRKIFRKLVYS